MKKHIKYIFCILTVLCLIASAGCSIPSTEQNSGSNQNDSTQAVVEETTSKYPECPADLNEYMSQNMEVYGYIVIPGTNISYPIVQSRKNDNYYLRRDWKGNNSGSGCIFSQSANSTDFTDPVTVLYGHNTGNGDMFSQLLNYKDENFFAENNLIYVYIPGCTLVYQIFSAHTFDTRHILNSYDFSNTDVYAEFLQYLLDPPVVEKTVANDMELSTADHILTLSTCAEAYSGCNERYLVNGVLIDYVLES